MDAGPGRLITLTEGQCVLQGVRRRCAAVSALIRAETTGSERPSGVSTRQGVRSAHLGMCKDRVCAPDAFSFSQAIGQSGCHLPFAKCEKGFLCDHKNPNVVSDMQCRVYAPVALL